MSTPTTTESEWAHGVHYEAPEAPTNGEALGRALILLAGLVFVTSLGAVVALEALGKPTTAVMALAGPVVSALFLGGFLQALTSRQNRTINQIQRQTNGVMDARIRVQSKAAALEAIKEAGLVSPEAIVTQPVTPGLNLEDQPGVAPGMAGFVDATLVPSRPSE